MDPLSISVSIVAILQATTTVISICYDFRACIKVIDEVKSLRNILETLEQLSQAQASGASPVTKRDQYSSYCDPENGPLVSYERELGYLEEKVIEPMGKGRGRRWWKGEGPKRRALFQAVVGEPRLIFEQNAIT